MAQPQEELEGLFGPVATDPALRSKPALVNRIIEHSFTNRQMTLEQLATLDVEYQWARLEDEPKKSGVIKEWRAFEFVFEEDEGEGPGKFSTSGPNAVARSDPRRLQHFLQQELTTYFENYCFFRLHAESGALWMRIQLSEADTATRPNKLYTAGDGNKEACLKWHPTSDNTVFLAYFLNTRYCLASPIKKDFVQYIVGALKAALGARACTYADLKGPNFTGLKQLMLERHSQGAYKRFKRAALDVHPLEDYMRPAVKRTKTAEEETQEARLVAEDDAELKAMYDQIDQVFGLNDEEAKFEARWKALSRHESDQPALKQLQIDIKAPFGGTVSRESMDALEGTNLTCRVRIEGPNIIEGFKQMVSANQQFILPSKDATQKVGLPDFLQNLHSLAKSHFSFDFTEPTDDSD